jgi:hypothetical protein
MTEESTQDEKPIPSGEFSQPGDSIEARETPARKKSRLAAGMRVEDWAGENSVPRSTTYRWAALPEVKAEIREWRRRAIHETIALFACNSKDIHQDSLVYRTALLVQQWLTRQ